jgi:predicted acylesterase/phospholipase RssA
VPVASTPAEQAAQTRPKLGLALSGGGFRAAYFHLGVLARLAERGLLRHVEAISTVSGGSILGALYYLHVKNLLESKPAAEIEDDDYVDLVRDMAEHFDDLGRKNLRARAFLEHPFRNFQLVRRGYSRTNLIGELYEEWLYGRVWRGESPHAPAGARSRPDGIEMRALTIVPAGQEPGFDVDAFNDSSPAKLPILLLNAANLTTGHGWRFEAVYMGELDVHAPDGDGPEQPNVRDPARDEVDKNTTLARTPWSRIPAPYDRLTLGFAVASSGAFPGLFVPSVLRRLFRRADGSPVEVKLMDGGAHDNQGVEALFDRGCNRLVVSDAAAQLPDIDRPATRLPALLHRAESLLEDRVRELQLTTAMGAVPIALMHLEKGLPEPVLRPGGTPSPDQPGLTSFGVDTRVQALLARVRTDLDSFSELEARSLSLDGYLMVDASLAEPYAAGVSSFGIPKPPDPGAWQFGTPLIRASVAARPAGAYRRQLRASRSRLFKPLMLLGIDKIAGVVGGVAAFGGAGYGVWRLWDTGTPFDGGWTVIGIVTALALLVLYAAPSSKFVVSTVAALVFDVVVPAVFALVNLVLWPFLAAWAWFWNQAYLILGSEQWARGDAAERNTGFN